MCPANVPLPRRLGRLTAVLLVAFAVVAAASSMGRCFLWNLTPSLPRGLYLLDRTATAERGAVVALRPPALAAELIALRDYLPVGASLLKIVVALPGDRVCVDERSFTANGWWIGAVASQDSAGRPLVPFLFCGVVPDGRAFVATTSRLSFDSRYFGPVPLSDLTVAVPAWTF
jgi:conjugative transfer signal peptidase TraF